MVSAGVQWGVVQRSPRVVLTQITDATVAVIRPRRSIRGTLADHHADETRTPAGLGARKGQARRV